MRELCLDFLNTRWYLTHQLNKEILTERTLLREFLEERDLHVEIAPSGEIVKNLLDLRTFLARTLEDYIRDNAVSPAAVKRINHYLALSSFRRIMKPGSHGCRITIQPLAFDWNWTMAEITASFVELIEYGDANRIKICENPDCKWFFYDETKSRTKRWCDDKCASLMKVRKFRRKQRAGPDGCETSALE